jgi:hypothetical protein
VLDTSGSPITGWTDLSITSGGVLDISSLSVSQSGTSPTIQVQAGSVDGALLDDITGVVKFESSAPELCLVLKAAQVCPSVTPDPTDTSVPNGLIQSIAVTTPAAGNSVGSEFNATIAGTNTGSVCAPTIALMSITRQSASVPTSAAPSLLLATTGANPIVGAVIFGSAATLAISGSLLLWKRRRLSN